MQKKLPPKEAKVIFDDVQRLFKYTQVPFNEAQVPRNEAQDRARLLFSSKLDRKAF